MLLFFLQEAICGWALSKQRSKPQKRKTQKSRNGRSSTVKDGEKSRKNGKGRFQDDNWEESLDEGRRLEHPGALCQNCLTVTRRFTSNLENLAIN